MLTRIPAHIMVPENGTWVFCDGIDSFDVMFRDLLGRRVDGCWTLEGQEPFKAITHWKPLAETRFNNEFTQIRTERTVRPFVSARNWR